MGILSALFVGLSVCASAQAIQGRSAIITAPSAGVTANVCATGKMATGIAANGTLTCADIPTAVPQSGIIFIDTGTCPSGFAEVSGLNGKTIIGTLAANGDVGTTGGADTITPAGTVAAPTFTGSSATTSAVSAGTPAGTNGSVAIVPLLNAIAWPGGVPTLSGSSAAITAGTPAGTISALTTGADSSTTGGVAKAIAQTPTFTGSALGTHLHGVGTYAIAWPVGVPTVTGASTTVGAQTFTGSALGTHAHTLTATGTNNAPTFTGTDFDNRSAFVKWIACKKS